MGTEPKRVASMGIDVAVARGLDIVVLDDSLRVTFGPTTLRQADLADLIRRTEPHVIAIDSPPAWGPSGKSRPAERQLQSLGISIFPTPSAEFARSLHRWMKTGFDVFRLAGDLGYPLYTGGASSSRSAIEVFPHASAVVLRGSLAPVGVAKSVWRRRVLEAAGIDCSEMRTTDHLDAALAALTGLKFLMGDFSVVGTPGEAVLVLPIGDMPTKRYARDQGAAISPKLAPHAPRRALLDETGHACGCGCGAPARRRYLPGHDAKHRSRLLAEMLAGNASAANELQRLGWARISAVADESNASASHPFDEAAYEQELAKVTIGKPQRLTAPIELAPYSSTWPLLYEREAARIRSILNSLVVRIEHVGSTSVDTLPAKPIIDIALEVPDSSDENAYVPPLEAAGYLLRIREADWFEHRLFKGPDTNINLHTFSAGCTEVDRMLTFRDWLRTNAADRDLYARTKRELAARDWTFVQQYADAKTVVVTEIMARAVSAG